MTGDKGVGEGPLEKEMEELASLEHDRWSRWHLYARANWTPENVERWDRQARTKYQDLSEREKESDRKEVRKYADILIAAFIEGRKAERERCALIAETEIVEHQDGEESYLCGTGKLIAEKIRGGQDGE